MTIMAIVCFVTYHFIVRSTFIGKFLNGRCYSRSLKDIKLDQKMSTQLKVANN
jgi:glucans biosynthesis protein C